MNPQSPVAAPPGGVSSTIELETRSGTPSSPSRPCELERIGSGILRPLPGRNRTLRLSPSEGGKGACVTAQGSGRSREFPRGDDSRIASQAANSRGLRRLGFGLRARAARFERASPPRARADRGRPLSRSAGGDVGPRHETTSSNSSLAIGLSMRGCRRETRSRMPGADRWAAAVNTGKARPVGGVAGEQTDMDSPPRRVDAKGYDRVSRGVPF